MNLLVWLTLLIVILLFFHLLFGLCLDLRLLSLLLRRDLLVAGRLVVAERGYAHVSKKGTRSGVSSSRAHSRGILRSCR